MPESLKELLCGLGAAYLVFHVGRVLHSYLREWRRSSILAERPQEPARPTHVPEKVAPAFHGLTDIRNEPPSQSRGDN